MSCYLLGFTRWDPAAFTALTHGTWSLPCRASQELLPRIQSEIPEEFSFIGLPPFSPSTEYRKQCLSGAHLEKQGFQFLQILVTHFALIHQKLSIHRKYIYRKLVLYNRFFVWIRHLWASLQNILSLSPSPLVGRGRETDPWGLYPQPQHMQGTHSTELSPTTLGFKY